MLTQAKKLICSLLALKINMIFTVVSRYELYQRVHGITLYNQRSLGNHEHAALPTTYGPLDKTPFELSTNKKPSLQEPLSTYEQFFPVLEGVPRLTDFRLYCTKGAFNHRRKETLQPICCNTGSNVGGKTRNITIQLVLKQCWKKSAVTRFTVA